MIKVRFLALVVLLAIFSAGFAFESFKPHSCTIFTAVQGEQVLFGDNLGYHEPDLLIGFYPAFAEGYGSIHFGYRKGEGQSYQRVVNDQGLAWAVNSIPRGKLNPHPEKKYSYIEDEYLHTISKKAATVDDAIRIAQDFDFGDSMIIQIHIADANGDAVVIGPGRDGEFAGEILNAVHLRTLTTHTLHSNLIDLKNGDIYIYYMSQYDEVVKLNIAEELAKGRRVVETRSLFSPETAEAGDASYRRFELRFRSAQVAVVIGILGLVAGVVTISVKKLKHRKATKKGEKRVHPQTA